MSVDEELDKLQQLRDAGTITDEQYERARAKLLDGEPAAHDEARADEPEREKRRPRRARRDEIDSDERTGKRTREMAMLLHLSLFAGHVVPFGGIIAPIVIWQTQKEEMPELDEHGKNAMNWIITFLISMCVFVPLSFAVIGIPFVVVACALNVVFPIIAAVKASEGIMWRYPLTIAFLK